MPAAQSNFGDGRMTQSVQAPRRLTRRIGKSGLLLCAAAGLALAGGFAWFVGRVPAHEAQLSRDADGIVALTGGASRIADAIELLASGRGRTLLITGGNRTTH